MSSEEDWTAGNQAAWRSMLGECLRQLGRDGEKSAAAVAELEDVRVQVRELTKIVGLDWEDELHLGDAIQQINKQIREDYGEAELPGG